MLRLPGRPRWMRLPSLPRWWRWTLVLLVPLCLINISVAVLGRCAVFPLSPFFLRQKLSALGRYAWHRPGRDRRARRPAQRRDRELRRACDVRARRGAAGPLPRGARARAAGARGACARDDRNNPQRCSLVTTA